MPGIVENSIDGKIFEKLDGLLLVGVVLEDLSVHQVQGIDLDELCQKAYNLEDDGHLGLMSVAGQSG